MFTGLQAAGKTSFYRERDPRFEVRAMSGAYIVVALGEA